MARKYDFISELYNRTCKTVVANPASWEAFLRSACYNYRLRFDEQLKSASHHAATECQDEKFCMRMKAKLPER